MAQTSLIIHPPAHRPLIIPPIKWIIWGIFFGVLGIQAQNQFTYYSHNFSMRGKIFEKSTGKPYSNACVWALGFGVSRIIKTNAQGEYEVKFYDTEVDSLSTPEMIPDGEIIFVWCEDPNKTQSVYLHKTKIKRTQAKDEFTHPPQVIKMNIRLSYHFEF